MTYKEIPGPIEGYKVFNNDMTCRDFQFEIGKVNELGNDRELELRFDSTLDGMCFGWDSFKFSRSSLPLTTSRTKKELKQILKNRLLKMVKEREAEDAVDDSWVKLGEDDESC